MKKTFAERITKILKNARIPANIIAVLLAMGKNKLAEVVVTDNVAELKAVRGIAQKRATVIVAALKKAVIDGRYSNRAEKREKAPGYSCRTFSKEELWRDVIELANKVSEYRPTSEEDPAMLMAAVELKNELDKKLDELFARGLTVREKNGRIIRLNKSAMSEVCKVDYASKKPTDRIAIVEYGVQEVFDFSPALFSNDVEIGKEKKADYQKAIMENVIVKGIRCIKKDDAVKPVVYGIVASSAAHQKSEKGMMVQAAIMKQYGEFFWFGKSLNEFATTTRQTGAERLKAMANLLRPWMKPFTSKGKAIRMKDILFVKDVEKVYVIKNARRIGQLGGVLVKDGEDKEAKILLDGAILSLVELDFQGQASSAGLKGFFFDGTSSIKALCKKHGMTVEEFLDCKVRGIDGRLHRVGDYKAIAGEGCWKLDKCFESFDEYTTWLKRQSKIHPGLDEVYLLRQSEEIEDEDKVRRLTKSLIQQWIMMSQDEIDKLTKRVRNDLRSEKSFKGSVRKLAALWKNPEDRTAVENLFFKAPWLVMNPVIQNYLEESWNRKLVEAASCKFRTIGQYPYIMQDPVAGLEVWVLGMDPNSPDLGVLKGDEVSVADVPNGKELLCVRFPANFLTAMVMKNKACREEFASMNGVMVISVHSTILIMQDGDVDGDEMCVIYDKLAIELTKRMIEKYHPPVVLFQHGSKGDKPSYANPTEFLHGVADALWMAKRYDSVGLYANLAMKCCYLATVYEARNDIKERDNALLWMSVASTGAIIAIDQVKGNAIDESLIKWLEDIQNKVRKAFRKIAEEMGISKNEQYLRQNPYAQYFNEVAKRREASLDRCLPANEDNYVDRITETILKSAGTWKEYNSNGKVWNAPAADEALFGKAPAIRVKYGKVTQEMLDLLGDNWFKFAAKINEIDATRETLMKMRVGTQLGMKEFMLLLWRNEASMAYTMEGRQLWEKKEEYYGVCRELIRMFLASGNWVNEYAKSYPVGYKFNEEERWNIAVNAVVRDALEISGSNGLDKNKGSYAMFCLRLFAADLLANLEKNRVDGTRFCLDGMEMDDILEDMQLEAAEETIEIFESAPVSKEVEEEEDVPPMTEEELLEYLAQQDDYVGWVPSMEDGYVPEEG